MPLFEYKCGECGSVVEILALSSGEDVPPAVCPKCKVSSGFTKQYSAFATHSMAGPELPQHSCGGGNCCGGSCAWEDN